MGDREPADGPAGLNTEVPHPARMYDYWLGGKDNFAADRVAADQVASVTPEIREMARANRAFLGRAVRMIAGAGVVQFLDIGTGIPTAGNTHEIAQRVAPDAHVVYVDNDPIVLTHSKALIHAAGGSAQTAIIQADARETGKILSHPELKAVLDFDQPVAIMLLAILHFIVGDAAYQLVEQLKAAVPAGSYLAISHVASDLKPDVFDRLAPVYGNPDTGAMRSRQEVADFFAGWELLEPGVVPIPLWRPDGSLPLDVDRYWIYGAVGRKG